MRAAASESAVGDGGDPFADALELLLVVQLVVRELVLEAPDQALEAVEAGSKGPEVRILVSARS